MHKLTQVLHYLSLKPEICVYLWLQEQSEFYLHLAIKNEVSKPSDSFSFTLQSLEVHVQGVLFMTTGVTCSDITE